MADSSRTTEPTLQPAHAAFEQLCGAIEGNDAALTIARELHQAYTGTMQEVLDYTARSMEQLRMQQTETRAQVDDPKDEVHQQYQAHLSAMGKLQKSIDNNTNAIIKLQQNELATQAEIDELKDEQERQELETRKNRALVRRGKELKKILKPASISSCLVTIIRVCITAAHVIALCFLHVHRAGLSDAAFKALGPLSNWDVIKTAKGTTLRLLRMIRSLPDEKVEEDEFTSHNARRLERLSNKARAHQRLKNDPAEAKEEKFETGRMAV